ncbi:MAG: isoleucyl-tRNA synthetase [Gammaproteobacteria bacterium]|jgi:isoleucyl-tRNA synthetase
MTKQFRESKGVDLSEIERELLDWWAENNIFDRCIENRRDGETFTFYEGPPTANGRPGIHHILGRTIKDTFCRYKTLKGYRVNRKAGWDTHGLPVEIEVEKALGLDGREQIEKYGIAAFNQACKDSVARYKKDWDDLTRRIGYWVDLDNPYVTYETNYMESVWWLIKQIFERGLLYKGYKIQWYSPGSGTVLSSHEVSLGYKEITDPSVYVRFRSTTEQGLSFLAWTTTPWTLISNVALAVGPDISYVKVRITEGETAGELIILAEARLSALTSEYEIIEKYTGQDLVGQRYEPPFTVADAGDTSGAWRIVPASYVSTEDGTGIVHQAPAFGAEDYEVAQREGLPMFNPMGPDGRFTSEAPLVAGVWFKDANKIINRDLKERGLLYRQESYLHNYPHDWRKGTPLMSYPVESWFVRTTAVKDQLVNINRTINWHPPAIRDGRFGNWLENNVDWALSRKRYWGTPLPIWISDKEDSEYFEVIGSIEELRSKCQTDLPADDQIDLHRPYVDEITWPAPDGGTMRRVPDVIDVWFDSGAMPFAQWHYPFENKEQFDQAFPADFICEGVDQTRGWFYTLHAISTLVRGESSFKNCVVNGLLLDEKGEKMSKSKGNTIDPFETVATYGADVVRWYMLSNSPPWDNMKFAIRGLTETRNKFFNTLDNVYRFMASYANIDGFHYNDDAIPVAERSELDRWVLSRLHSTTDVVDASFASYDATRAARAVEEFVDDLSNWYIRRSRPRFWAAKKGGAHGATQVTDRDKLCAYQTTYECLVTVAKLMSPIAPFFSDWLFRNLNDVTDIEPVESVHLADFPVRNSDIVDAGLEQRMDLARSIVTLVLLLRNKSNLNVRQPLSRILLVVGGRINRDVVESVKTIILDEVNIQAIEYIDDSSGIVKRSAKANFKRLGSRLGKKMKLAAAQIAEFGDEQITKLLVDGNFDIDLDGEIVRLEPDDIEISSEELGDWSVAQEGQITIALDVQVTDDLLLQGLAREAVNRLQGMRKSADLALTDRIRVEYSVGGDLNRAFQVHGDLIRREILAVELIAAEHPRGTFVESFEINGQSFGAAVTVAPAQ